ncbi:3121_t:CDS:2, partial [Scutellospora calospora]
MILPKHTRWKIVEKNLEGLLSRVIAKHLGVSRASVGRVLKQFQKYGCVEDLPSLSGRSSLLNIDDIKYLKTFMKEKPDCLTTIWRAMHRLGYTNKQVRNKVDRDNFVIRISQYTLSQLVFSDESAYDQRTLSRCYGWSFSGLRTQKYIFFVREKQFTIEGVLCIDGLLAYSIQEGSMNTKDYDDFIEFVLIEQTFFYIKNYLQQNKIWVELMPNPLEVLDLTCMMINRKLAYACYQYSVVNREIVSIVDVEVEPIIDVEVELTIDIEIELTSDIKVELIESIVD